MIPLHHMLPPHQQASTIITVHKSERLQTISQQHYREKPEAPKPGEGKKQGHLMNFKLLAIITTNINHSPTPSQNNTNAHTKDLFISASITHTTYPSFNKKLKSISKKQKRAHSAKTKQ